MLYFNFAFKGNFSNKFEEFANQLWKSFGRDYTIPDNLAQYAEEYFEDYKSAFTNEENPLQLARFQLQCLPEPGELGSSFYSILFNALCMNFYLRAIALSLSPLTHN